MTRVGRAVEKGETDGFMKILVGPKGKRSWARSDSMFSRASDVTIERFTDHVRATAPMSNI